MYSLNVSKEVRPEAPVVVLSCWVAETLVKVTLIACPTEPFSKVTFTSMNHSTDKEPVDVLVVTFVELMMRLFKEEAPWTKTPSRLLLKIVLLMKVLFAEERR